MWKTKSNRLLKKWIQDNVDFSITLTNKMQYFWSKSHTWKVIMAILSICSIIFHGLRPLALYFWHGLMKKYFSFLLKFSTD